MKDSLLQHDTVALNAAKDALHIIDQTKLPGELVFLDLRTQAEIWHAIQTLQVRGAPAIGVAAAYGLYLAAREIQATDADDFRVKLHDAAEYLASSRPTAVNLRWALERPEDWGIRSGAGAAWLGTADPLQRRSAGYSEVRHRHSAYLPGAGAGLSLPGVC